VSAFSGQPSLDPDGRRFPRLQTRCVWTAASETFLPRAQLPDSGDGEEHTHCEEFDFADLRFIKSSRMSKRRLAFVLQLQVG